MNKYAQVRHKLQELVNDLSEEQQNLIDCGKPLFLQRLETSKDCHAHAINLLVDMQSLWCPLWPPLTSLLRPILWNTSIDF